MRRHARGAAPTPPSSPHAALEPRGHAGRPDHLAADASRSAAGRRRPAPPDPWRAARAGIPVVAIVGRPNVGKSTLFNRIVGQRTAIVEDRARTTRDRLYGDAEWNGRRFVIVDTGGLELDPDDPIEARVQEQARLAIAEADVIVFVVDAATGMTPADLEAATHPAPRHGAGHRRGQQGRQREARARRRRVPRARLGRDLRDLGRARPRHRRPARRDRLGAAARERGRARAQGARGRGRGVGRGGRRRPTSSRSWSATRRRGDAADGDGVEGPDLDGRSIAEAADGTRRWPPSRTASRPRSRSSAGRTSASRACSTRSSARNGRSSRTCPGRRATRSTPGWPGAAARSSSSTPPASGGAARSPSGAGRREATRRCVRSMRCRGRTSRSSSSMPSRA